MQEREEKGHPLGLHRVLGGEAKLPQAAGRLDNQLPIYSNEILINVERLNIDAASFVQMEEESRGNADKIGRTILENTRSFGKQQNKVTGSGGMLIGEIAAIGKKNKTKLKKGDRVATLVSLTLTPLHLEKIKSVDTKTHQVAVEGHAILFEKTIVEKLPKDLPETVAMAAFDVAGAPATVAAICRPGDTLVVIGAGGKAGILSCVAGRRKLGKSGKIVAIEPGARAAADLEKLNVCNEILKIDATDPLAVQSGVEKATRGKMGSVVINVASVANTEMSSLLSARSKGKVVFFSMATSFTRVALGAEGILADALLIFGNGYYPGHGKTTLDLIRKSKPLYLLFCERYQA